MAKNKTQANSLPVMDFIRSVPNETRKNDSIRLLDIFTSCSGFPPVMWGPSIIGFGSYHYQYESGHEGDAPIVGFSPRKDALSLYLSTGFEGRGPLLEKLGKHKTSKACLYIKKLADIDVSVLEEMIRLSVVHTVAGNYDC